MVFGREAPDFAQKGRLPAFAGTQHGGGLTGFVRQKKLDVSRQEIGRRADINDIDN
jgi:hypothetical protein